jgi:transcriptional regulator with XRE-family HTH domain
MESLGETIRKHREVNKLPLRTVAAYLDIDQAILSKIERGQRKASREQVIKLAKYFQSDANIFLLAWLSDKLIGEVENEKLALKAIVLAEERIRHLTKRSKVAN